MADEKTGMERAERLISMTDRERVEEVLAGMDLVEHRGRVKAVRRATKNDIDKHESGAWPFEAVCPSGIFVRSRGIRELMSSWLYLYKFYLLHRDGEEGDAD